VIKNFRDFLLPTEPIGKVYDLMFATLNLQHLAHPADDVKGKRVTDAKATLIHALNVLAIIAMEVIGYKVAEPIQEFTKRVSSMRYNADVLHSYTMHALRHYQTDLHQHMLRDGERHHDPRPVPGLPATTENAAKLNDELRSLNESPERRPRPSSTSSTRLTFNADEIPKLNGRTMCVKFAENGTNAARGGCAKSSKDCKYAHGTISATTLKAIRDPTLSRRRV
jgi:hypothetical protein